MKLFATYFGISLMTFCNWILHANTFYQSFGSSKYETKYVYLTGSSVTHTFVVDGVYGNQINSFRTDWYSTEDVQGETGFIRADSSNFGNQYWDPTIDRTYTSAGTYYIRGEVMTRDNATQNFWWKETHQWCVVVQKDTTGPSNPTSWTGSDPINTWTRDYDLYVKWSGASDSATGLQKYYYKWDNSSSTTVGSSDSSSSETSGSGSQSKNSVSDGNWYFHIRYVDNSGNLASGTAHYGPFKIDRASPGTPTLSEPISDVQISTLRPTLKWSGPSDTSGIAKYHLKFSLASHRIPHGQQKKC